MRTLSRWATFLGILMLVATARAQSAVGVELDEVTDNRIAGMSGFTGSLDVRVKLTGTGLDKATAARVIIKEAKDDAGNVLAESGPPPDFTPRDYNMGTLQLAMQQPARTASSVRLKGTLELYVPTRDPNAIVKIDKALARLDAPLSAKALKAAKIEITPVSREGYAEAQKARKIDDKKIEQIRAEGKKQGIPEKEIELAIELARAFQGLDSDVPENAVIFTGKKNSFDRIFRIEVLGADGKPVNTTGRTLSTSGEDSVLTLMPSEAPPQNAALQLYVVTDKSRLSFPFELSVPLP